MIGRASSGLFLGHDDRELRAIGLGQPRLVLQPRGHRAVADLMRIAELVEVEQFRRQRFAAGMSLALVLIDAQFQVGGFRHQTKLPVSPLANALLSTATGHARVSIPRDRASFYCCEL